mmetsp:Transcript_38490/g.43938  ORF Transcript_38490/g.43938 Transcript_38490/m.43938 type:complete len:335 (+) Transcript_38490:442-1446(+)
MISSINSLELAIDKILVMRKQEDGPYLYESYLPNHEDKLLNVAWREKITQWTYNVIDHFDLSREIVAISLSLFDRFLATRSNKCNGKIALLTSLTTLHLAIKIHDKRKIRLSTLADLSRGQFTPDNIREMEWRILNALQWKLHPPTANTFVFYLLLFLPKEINPTLRKEILELSRYFTELAMCDSVLINTKASTIAFASVLNVLENTPCEPVPAEFRKQFIITLRKTIHLDSQAPEVIRTRERIARILASTQIDTSTFECTKEDDLTTVVSYDYEVPPKPTDAKSFKRLRTNSIDSNGGRGNYNRFSPSPHGRRVVLASPVGYRTRTSSAQMVA